MLAVIDIALWWIGLLVVAGALLLGLSEIGWWAINRLHRDYGLWREFFIVLRRIIKERRAQRERPGE